MEAPEHGRRQSRVGQRESRHLLDRMPRGLAVPKLLRRGQEKARAVLELRDTLCTGTVRELVVQRVRQNGELEGITLHEQPMGLRAGRTIDRQKREERAPVELTDPGTQRGKTHSVHTQRGERELDVARKSILLSRGREMGRMGTRDGARRKPKHRPHPPRPPFHHFGGFFFSNSTHPCGVWGGFFGPPAPCR